MQGKQAKNVFFFFAKGWQPLHEILLDFQGISGSGDEVME
jgi:hypothetical protein